MPLGLAQGAVALAEHDPGWRLAYRREHRLIVRALGARTAAIRHCGSTAVDGLKAKPIIDIVVGTRGRTDPLDCVRRLDGVGYIHHGTDIVPGEHFLTKGAPTLYHLHLIPWRGRIWFEKLVFLDRLHGDAGLRLAYETLKRELAARFPTDRAAYTAGKSSFIAAVLAGAAPPPP